MMAEKPVPPGLDVLQERDYVHRYDQPGDFEAWKRAASTTPVEDQITCPECSKVYQTNHSFQICWNCHHYVCEECCNLPLAPKAPAVLGKCSNCESTLGFLCAPLSLKMIFGRSILASLGVDHIHEKYGPACVLGAEVDEYVKKAQMAMAQDRKGEAAEYLTQALQALNWVESFAPGMMFGNFLCNWYRANALRLNAENADPEMVRSLVQSKPDAFNSNGLYACALQFPPSGPEDIEQAPYKELYMDQMMLPAGMQMTRDERAFLHTDCPQCISSPSPLDEFTFQHQGMVQWICGPSSTIHRLIDIRWVLPDESAAERFINDSRMIAMISEGQPLVRRFKPIGQDCKLFGGPTALFHQETRKRIGAYAFVFRIKNIVIKLFAAQGPMSGTALHYSHLQQLSKVAAAKAVMLQVPEITPEQRRERERLIEELKEQFKHDHKAAESHQALMQRLALSQNAAAAGVSAPREPAKAAPSAMNK
eukprot:gnl/Trimastix_PCT/2708.p1 GENE.gnl/Trimastix_PCT/2708~~gnl/Trimastix_PCT/2708.p1  ORF type:complete len:479 (-),score=136.47 gnl/Trimastix_PCT/2708:31-1467(-)